MVKRDLLEKKVQCFTIEANVIIHEQNLLNGCFPSPNDISFSINRDILDAEKYREKKSEKRLTSHSCESKFC